MYTILGAGLSGLSVADHLKKRGIEVEIFEAKEHGGGHIYSEQREGFTWDEGPHVSFTKSDYVRQYFADNAERYLEFETQPLNYFEGNWIPHPTQSNMYAVPEPLRTECIESVVKIRGDLGEDYRATNYQQWLRYAFGATFSEAFPERYTRKYWTVPAENLDTDWIGQRVYFPAVSDMVDSANAPLQKKTHYLTSFRYPEKGGYYSYIKKVEQSLPIQYNKELTYISFDEKRVQFSDGTSSSYSKLVSTLPLAMLISVSDAPEEVKAQARKLKCSQVLLVNVVVDQPTAKPNHWIYVYDEEMYSTRINFTELLSPYNGIEGQSGIQVEVYFSEFHPMDKPEDEITQKVFEELMEMKLIGSRDSILSYHSKFVTWANVIFDKERRVAQDKVLTWLSQYGLKRESDDLEPMTDWEQKLSSNDTPGDVILAGRFAQWKYYWTDDCVLRGLFIANNVSG